MITKYYADCSSQHHIRVIKIKIQRETARLIFLLGGFIEFKEAEKAAYFDSFKEAQDWLITKINRKIAKLKSSLRIEKERLSHVRCQR